MKLLKVGQLALHYSAGLTVRHFGTQNNALHVHHSAFHLPTCKAPERILSEAVAAASLQILSLAEANAGTGVGTSIFSSIRCFSNLFQPQLWEATRAPHYFWPSFETRPHLQVLLGRQEKHCQKNYPQIGDSIRSWWSTLIPTPVCRCKLSWVVTSQVFLSEKHRSKHSKVAKGVLAHRTKENRLSKHEGVMFWI